MSRTTEQKKQLQQAWQERLALLKEFQEVLRYQFGDETLLMEALTHSSAARDDRRSPEPNGEGEGNLAWNERLEFLGDAVLGLAVAASLMEKAPDLSEGDLSRLRSAVVREEALAACARSLELGRFLWLGKSEEVNQGHAKDSILADAMEALFGAIFLDADFTRAHQFISNLLLNDFELMDLQTVHFDYKTKLQELTQALFREPPRYELMEVRGPAHAPEFLMSVWLKDSRLGSGTGASKKRAEQRAAQEALGNLTEQEPTL